MRGKRNKGRRNEFHVKLNNKIEINSPFSHFLFVLYFSFLSSPLISSNETFIVVETGLPTPASKGHMQNKEQ